MLDPAGCSFAWDLFGGCWLPRPFSAKVEGAGAWYGRPPLGGLEYTKAKGSEGLERWAVTVVGVGGAPSRGLWPSSWSRWRRASKKCLSADESTRGDGGSEGSSRHGGCLVY